MTYTFKLARRLAVSRHFVMLPALALLVACSGDSTAPEAADSSVLQTQTIATGVSYKVGRGRSKKPGMAPVLSVSVSPDAARLDAGGQQSFSATGYLSDGSTVTVDVDWQATGGTINPNGVYAAGSVPGTYRIVGHHVSSNTADTAEVTVSAPVLAQVVLNPGSVTLGAGATQQFAGFGRTSVGDSVAVAVAFSATGGTITSGGLFTAGSTGGTFRVVAKESASGLADSSAVTIAVAAQAPTPSGSGIAFGNFNTPSTALGGGYTGVVAVLSPSDIYTYLNAARAAKARVIVSLAGGPGNYRNADGTFSLELWKQRVARFQGMDLSSYIADGTLLGHYLMDEPFDPTNWGGQVLTFAEIEAMGQYSKQLFPTLTTMVRAHPTWLAGYSGTWRYLDAAWAQYSARKGDVNNYIRYNVTSAKAQGLGLVIGLNTLDGGDGSSGIPGTYAGAYAMSATEIRNYGKVLASDSYVCALMMWKYSSSYLGRPDIDSAMLDVSSAATNRPAAICRVH
jgi:hypothetical protein